MKNIFYTIYNWNAKKWNAIEVLKKNLLITFQITNDNTDSKIFNTLLKKVLILKLL